MSGGRRMDVVVGKVVLDVVCRVLVEMQREKPVGNH